MKTPRELILGQHGELEFEFDTMRARILSEARQTANASPGFAQAGRLWFTLAWRELVLPCRLFWNCCGTVFVALLLLNIMLGLSADSGVSAANMMGSPQGHARELLQEQSRLRAELMDGVIVARPPGSPSRPPVWNQSLRNPKTILC